MSGEAQNTQQQTTETEKQNAVYKKIEQEIYELNDKDKSNDKVQLEWILTTEFAEKLDQPTASTLLTEAKKAQSDNTDQWLKNLIAFLEPIAKPHQVNWKLEVSENENQANSVIENFDNYFWTTWSLKDISLLPEESQNELDTAKEQLTQKQEKERIEKEREKASKSTMSFKNLSEKLKIFNNDEINWILTQQIAPLNEQLKQWPSINELNAKISELKWKINSYDKDWNWLDNKDKKWNRKTINDLQNELKQTEKEFYNKTDIKNDLSTQLSKIKKIIKKILSPDNTKNEIILKNIKDFYGLQNNENTSIIKKENEQEQEQDRTPFSQYERSLDDIWNGKEPSETTQWESSPEQTAQTQTPEQAQKAVNKPRTVNTGLSALFDKVGFKRDENVWFWKNIWNALWAVFGSYFWFSMKWKESIVGIIKPDQINLENFESESEIRTTLEAINNETKAFNWRKEIVNAINGKEEQQIKNLQRKLRKFPNWKQESPIEITWTIDEATATALKTYATKQVNENEQNNWTEMPYAFCEWYTKVKADIQNNEIYKENWETSNNYILIQKNENWNITSITKWELKDNQTVNWETSTIPTLKNTAETYELWTWENEKTIVKKKQQTS